MQGDDHQYEKVLARQQSKKQLDRREPDGTKILRRSNDILKNQKGELVDNMETEREENERLKAQVNLLKEKVKKAEKGKVKEAEHTGKWHQGAC